jgi:hypothetical protein
MSSAGNVSTPEQQQIPMQDFNSATANALQGTNNLQATNAGITPGLTNDISSVSGAFNPSGYSGLYNQMQQQNQQQNAVINSQNGVAGTPYGAGIAQTQNQNFNNNWQTFLNQQQGTAANTTSTLASSLGGLEQLPVSDYLSFLGAANQSTNAATGVANTQLQQNQQQFNQNAGIFGGIGQLAGFGASFL